MHCWACCGTSSPANRSPSEPTATVFGRDSQRPHPDGPRPERRAPRVLKAMTEPLLGPLRAMVPPVRIGGMGLDLSPIILLVGLMLLANIVC